MGTEKGYIIKIQESTWEQKDTVTQLKNSSPRAQPTETNQQPHNTF